MLASRLCIYTVALSPRRVVQGGREESRSVRVPPHRYTPLKENWEAIVKPLVDHMKLLVRMNTKARAVEIKVRCCCEVLRSSYSNSKPFRT